MASMRSPPILCTHAHPFDRSGLAALSDLETREWRELFSHLEKEQSEFLGKEGEFRSREYKWPRDPLHTWSRVWEYPYGYYHLQQVRSQWPAAPPPRVVDFGSGVTFFPYSVARMGYHVTCADVDPVCATDIPRAAAVMPHGPGKVDFRLVKDQALPFKNAEIDAVYCVSVLEHIPDPEATVMELARILKPGGLLLLTIDLDLRGDSGIGVLPHRKLVTTLKTNFNYHCLESTVHPANLLDNTRGPFKTPILTGFQRVWFLTRQSIKHVLGKRPHRLLPFLLTVQGLVLTKKG